MVTVCQRPSLTVVWRVRVVSWGEGEEEEEEELCDKTMEPSSSYSERERCMLFSKGKIVL